MTTSARGVVVLVVALAACRSASPPPAAPPARDGAALDAPAVDAAGVAPDAAVAVAASDGGGAVAPDDEPSRPGDALRVRMQGHFDEIRLIERLLLEGELVDAKEHATAIAFDRLDADVAAFAPYLARMRRAADALAAATSVEGALRHATQLAAECAQCHVAAKADPWFSESAPPTADATAADRMARHQWAVDRLWEGVVGPSAQAWGAGLDILASKPLPAAVLGDRARQREVEGWARQLAREARRAAAARTPTARARAYGDLLVICAQCHAAS